MPIVDGSAIKDFPVLPEGKYNCRFETWKNADNNENVRLDFTVDEGEFMGQKLFHNQNLKPQSLWAFKKTAMALGADAEAFVGMFDTDEVLHDLVGNPCRLDVGVYEAGHQYEGRNYIKEVLAPSLSVR